MTPMLRYLLYSIFVTIIDTLIVWILYRVIGVNVVVSNTTGVVIGFIIHYLLSSKSVFDTDLGIPGFIIYLLTFLIGLALADWLIYAGETKLFQSLPVTLSFLSSKGLSIVLPFFFLYFLRKLSFNLLSKYIKAQNNADSK
jgi:putative flippase GtrA